MHVPSTILLVEVVFSIIFLNDSAKHTVFIILELYNFYVPL